LKKVSVIIPCYNQSEYIFDTVKSVEDSTYENIEIIVINDGSTDISTENLDNILKNFENLKIIHKKNSGVCESRNKGIDEAKGDYILPLDGDDKIAPTYIEKAVKILEENPDVGIVYCDAEYFGKIQKKLKTEPATTENMLIQNRIFSTALYRKSDFLKTEGYRNEMLIGCEDWDLWLSFIEQGKQIYKIPETLFFYRKQENLRTQKSIKFLNYFKIRKRIISLHKNLYKKYFWQVICPMIFCILKNLGYNILKFLKFLFFKIKKFIRRIYFKIAIKYFNLYPNIKRIDKNQKQKEIKNFLNNKSFGNKKVLNDIIISLTSIPDRMYDIHFTIFSLLTQSVKPEKIILYLGKEKFSNGEKDIPENVLIFKNFGLEFRFVEDIRSFTKLVPALEEFPDKTIVTADDDIFYEKDWLKNLIETHKKYPKDIIVHKHLNVICHCEDDRSEDVAIAKSLDMNEITTSKLSVSPRNDNNKLQKKERKLYEKI